MERGGVGCAITLHSTSPLSILPSPLKQYDSCFCNHPFVICDVFIVVAATTITTGGKYAEFLCDLIF